MRSILLGLVAAGICAAAEGRNVPASTAAEPRTVGVSQKSLIKIPTTILMSTMIVLPEGELVAAVDVGDTGNWKVETTHVPSQFVWFKPKTAKATTDLHIVTDHKHSYTFSLYEVSGTGEPYDVKVFLDPDDALQAGINQPPSMISAEEAERYKREATEAKTTADAVTAKAKEDAQSAQARFRREYSRTLKFYHYDAKKADKLGVEKIYHDTEFTYIKGHPIETPTVYEKSDKKPGVIDFWFADDLYTIPKILRQGYLKVGKQEMEFSEVSR